MEGAMARSLASRLVERLAWVDPVAGQVQKAAAAVLMRDGANTPLKSFLNGSRLGHALHPALTDVPVGAWTGAAVLDLLAMATGSEGMAKGADASLALGVAGAVGAAATGLADWSDTSGETRRIGMVHALLNTVALTLNLASLAKRLGGDRRGGVLFSSAAFGVASVSAYLGGELVFAKGLGVSHQIWPEPPGEFTPVLDAAALPKGKLTQAKAGDVATAFGDWCTHLGGPLSEGTLDGELVTCPWHGSQFELTTGDVARGPATIPSHRFEARIQDGKVQVKPAEPLG
jgi:nitrite reductase/ring-hydroxylating ferredoxin subunit/uncharacterized membrane protein